MNSKERLLQLKEINKEVKKIRKELDEVKKQLDRNKIKYSERIAQANSNHTDLVN